MSNQKSMFTFKNFIVAVTFVLILVTSIIFKQKFVVIFPVFISLFIMAFQADANRYAYLAGGLNAVIYTGIYVYLGLYASAASALLFSFPMQLITFINWKKKSYENSTMFKKMSAKVRIVVSVLFILCFAVLYIGLKAMGSDYAILDNVSTLVGIMVTVLTMLAFIEYSYLWILSGILQIVLNVQVMMNNQPEHITYVIFSVYCFYCIVLAFINVRKLYAKQQKEMKSNAI